MTDVNKIDFLPIGTDSGYGVSGCGMVINLLKNSVIKPIVNGEGYLLFNAGRKIKLTVHREVARLFVPNPCNLPVVNHKDGNKQNNHYSNLEWVTHSENSQHAYDTGLHKPPCLGKFGKDHVASKPIVQYNLDGVFVREWENARQAEREAGFHNGRISDVCNGKYHSHKGFIFKFK